MQQQKRRPVFRASLAVKNVEPIDLGGAVRSWIFHGPFLSLIFSVLMRTAAKIALIPAKNRFFSDHPSGLGIPGRAAQSPTLALHIHSISPSESEAYRRATR